MYKFIHSYLYTRCRQKLYVRLADQWQAVIIVLYVVYGYVRDVGTRNATSTANITVNNNFNTVPFVLCIRYAHVQNSARLLIISTLQMNIKNGRFPKYACKTQWGLPMFDLPPRNWNGKIQAASCFDRRQRCTQVGFRVLHES